MYGGDSGWGKKKEKTLVFSAAMLLSDAAAIIGVRQQSCSAAHGKQIVLEAQHKSRLGKDREACEERACQGSDTFN